jgi:hypothetical protein
MNQEQIINLTLCEVCETDNMSIPIAKLCSNLGWSTILHLITKVQNTERAKFNSCASAEITDL